MQVDDLLTDSNKFTDEEMEAKRMKHERAKDEKRAKNEKRQTKLLKMNEVHSDEAEEQKISKMPLHSRHLQLPMRVSQTAGHSPYIAIESPNSNSEQEDGYMDFNYHDH